MKNSELRKNPSLPRKHLPTLQLQSFSLSLHPSVIKNADTFSVYTKCAYLDFSNTIFENQEELDSVYILLADTSFPVSQLDQQWIYLSMFRDKIFILFTLDL